MSPSTLNLLDDLPEIKPFPATASRVMAACDDPEIGSGELCEIMQCDPGIAMKIVQVANSSVYGLSGEVRSLQHAVVVLGFRSLRNLAVSIAAGEMFAGDGPAIQGREELWQHSMGCATVAMLLSRHSGVRTEEAFLAGIVHDVGKLIIYDVEPERYYQTAAGATADTIVAIEKELYGTDHQELGMRCADEWGLPMEISDAIGLHHLSPDDEADGLSELIGVADVLTRNWGIGTRCVDDLDVTQVGEQCSMALDSETLKAMEDEAHAELEVLKSALS